MRQYSKREFLKTLGIGLVMLPFIGCYDFTNDPDKGGKKGNKKNASATSPKDEINVTEEDVILLRRNDARYARYNQGFNKRIHTLPKYIAVCKTEKGVQFAIRKATEEQLKIAVKSGGHSFEGFSSNDGGMVINLSQMKKIEWLDDNRVSIEPGCLLQEIQAVLFPKKRLLPTGSCGTVGIAGLTLGGGYGFFSRAYGLTCDSLQQLRMVAADGNVYDSDQEADLLWACRGGGNGNFGIVTSFLFHTQPMPPTFSNFVFKFRNLDADRFRLLLADWFSITERFPPDAFSAFVLNGRTLTVLATHFKEHPDFQTLLTPLRNQSDRSYDHPKQDLPTAMKKYYGREGPIYFKNASAGMYRGKSDLQGLSTEIFNRVVARPGLIFQINTLGGQVTDPKLAAASCFPHRSRPYLSELQAYWDQENEATQMISAFESLQTQLRNHGITAHYRNYPDLSFPDWAHAYYGDNYTRLQQIKRRYDPEDYFHYPQSIRPA